MSAELVVEDPCWFYKSNDPVLVCTVHSSDGDIYWRRDDLFLGDDGRLLENNGAAGYNISSYSISVMRQEKLHISAKLAMSFIKLSNKFRCETRFYSSSEIYLHIPGELSA